MASYLDGTVEDQNDIRVAGASVYIYRSPEGLADLEDSLGQPLGNPVTTDQDGYWKAFVDDGYYTIRIFWGGRQRYVEANILAGDPPFGPTADPNLRADLAATNGSALVAHNGVNLFNILGVHYAVQPGEVGVVDQRYPSTDIRRYGPRPDGVTDWEGTTSYMTMAWRNLIELGKLRIPREGADFLYKTGWNTTNRWGYDLDGAKIEIEDGVVFGGIFHLVSSGSPVNRKTPTAVATGNPTIVTVAAGHGMTVGDIRYLTFVDTGMAALDGQQVLATPTSSTQFSLAANTAGQTWSATGEFHDVPLRFLNVGGTIKTPDRVGSIWAQDIDIDRIECISDPSMHVTGLQGRGFHGYYGLRNWNVAEIIVRDIGPQSESPTNLAAIAFDGDTNEPVDIAVARMQVDDSQASGIILKGKGFDVGAAIVSAYGRGSMTAAPEGINAAATDPIGYTAGTTAAAMWLVRGAGRIGSVRMGQENGYATGRSNASYGLAVEGALLEWADASTYTNTRKGWEVGQIEARNLKGIAVSLGAFGQAGYLTAGHIDLGKVESTNDCASDPVLRLEAAQVWVCNGELGYKQITTRDADLSHAIKTQADADASVNPGKITVETHQGRVVWHRGHGDIGDVEILDRTGTSQLDSVQVDGGASNPASIGAIMMRNPSGATGPAVRFAPISGSVNGRVSIIGYTGSALAIPYVWRWGDNNANRVMAQFGGDITKTGGAVGTGMILDGLVDPTISGFRVEGFAKGIGVGGANTRVVGFGNVSTGNTVNTDLTDAEMVASCKSPVGNNVAWSKP